MSDARYRETNSKSCSLTRFTALSMNSLPLSHRWLSSRVTDYRHSSAPIRSLGGYGSDVSATVPSDESARPKEARSDFNPSDGLPSAKAPEAWTSRRPLAHGDNS